jgi:hypothetical protein
MEIIKDNSSWINFVKEDGTVEQIQKIIKYTPACPSYFQFKPFFSFMVDDMLFFR